jgi:16S rRNA (cytidine1402-2'-O)-methyltransferase
MPRARDETSSADDVTPGTLFVVAVPIGNIGDLAPRAVEVLRGAAVVAAEDTRHFATLARHHGIATPALSYHDHNEVGRTAGLVARLRGGEDVALVSDAGTPLVSDPGYRLVRGAIDAGVPIRVVPGPSAVMAALAGSGLPPHPFRFVGFLPRTSAARRATLAGLAGDAATLVLFEAPHRIVAAVEDARAVLGDRPACLARNLTKPHERWDRGTLAAILTALSADDEIRGECTLVIGGAVSDAGDAAALDDDARLLLDAGAPARVAQDYLVARHGVPRRTAYAAILRQRGDG